MFWGGSPHCLVFAMMTEAFKRKPYIDRLSPSVRTQHPKTLKLSMERALDPSTVLRKALKLKALFLIVAV